MFEGLKTSPRQNFHPQYSKLLYPPEVFGNQLSEPQRWANPKGAKMGRCSLPCHLATSLLASVGSGSLCSSDCVDVPILLQVLRGFVPHNFTDTTQQAFLHNLSETQHIRQCARDFGKSGGLAFGWTLCFGTYLSTCNKMDHQRRES